MQKKMTYVPPMVTVTKVVLEGGITTIPMSADVFIQNDWIEVNDPVGNDPSTDGGDIVFLF